MWLHVQSCAIALSRSRPGLFHSSYSCVFCGEVTSLERWERFLALERLDWRPLYGRSGPVGKLVLGPRFLAHAGRSIALSRPFRASNEAVQYQPYDRESWVSNTSTSTRL
ncbi:hypothetical protein Y032_0490g2379 [Ancylostoma ceylanicum]|uniref:Uncharacterized protein n=1 Tax=Ancylostoma ceylanicum TaxID=53326 RepID=A0A016WVF1_9BILA|nr:hypothetical protein Y032_0490g2379 [Ancylostoma ceylanicum]